MARERGESLRIDGLAELHRALKELDADLPKELRQAGKDVAEFVASDARAAAHTIGGVAAHVAPSVKPSAGSTYAGVALGSAAYPMAAGAEFGGQGRPTTQQFKPHLGRTGYFLFPTIRRDADRIEDEFTSKVNDLIKRVGLA